MPSRGRDPEARARRGAARGPGCDAGGRDSETSRRGTDATAGAASDGEREADRDRRPEVVEGEVPYQFPHPQWTVGVVLVFAVVSLIFGLLVRPIWLVVGAPFIVVLLLWVVVRVVALARLLGGDTRAPDERQEGGG